LALLLVIAVFGLSVAGLAVTGPVGGVLLLIVAAILVTLSVGTWGRVRRQGAPVRVLIAAVIVGIAVAKLAHHL
jgi:hypothetical protein